MSFKQRFGTQTKTTHVFGVSEWKGQGRRGFPLENPPVPSPGPMSLAPAGLQVPSLGSGLGPGPTSLGAWAVRDDSQVLPAMSL